jgi:hypothetical protein
MISQDVCEKACNPCLGSNERGRALLDCIEAGVRALPSGFTKFVRILEADPFLESQAEELVKCYCELIGDSMHREV